MSSAGLCGASLVTTMFGQQSLGQVSGFQRVLLCNALAMLLMLQFRLQFLSVRSSNCCTRGTAALTANVGSWWAATGY